MSHTDDCLPLDLSRVRDRLNTDAEFRLHARYLTTTVRFVIGETQSFHMRISNGEIHEIDPVVTPFDTFDIQVAGSEEQWRALLAPVPAPFYQDFFPAMLHHGFRLEGDMETIMAYYPAIRRMQAIMRHIATSETMV